MIGILTTGDIALIVLVSLIVLVAPGVAFVYAAGGQRRPFIEWLTMGFGTAVSVAAVLSDVVNRFGGNVVVMFGLLMGLAFAAVPLGWYRPVRPAVPLPQRPARRSRGDRSRRSTVDLFAIATVIFALGMAWLASTEGLALTRTADTFYHLQAPRSLLATASTRVTDPFFGNKALPPDATAGTWPSVIAPISLLSAVDTLPIARVLAPLLAFLMVCAFYALARRFGAPGYAAFIATLAYVIGGTALEFRNILYPSRVAPMIWWVGLMWLVEWLELGGRRRMVVAGICLVAAATMHLSVAEAIIISLILTVFVASTWRAHGTLRLVAFTLAVIVIFFAVAWPSLAPLLGSKTLGIAGVDREDIRSQVPVWKGPLGFVIVPGYGLPSLGAFALLLGLALGAALWFRDAPEREAHRAPPASVALALPALLLNGLFTGALVERFWYHLLRLTVVFKAGPYLGGAAFLPDRAKFKDSARDQRAVYVVVAALVIGLGAVQGSQAINDRFAGTDVAQSFAYNRANDRSVALAPLVAKLTRLGVRPGTVVAAPMLSLAYELAGLTGYRVIAVPASHLPVAVGFGDGPQRLADAEKLYAPHTPSMERARLLSKYAVQIAIVPADLGNEFYLAGWRQVGQVGRSIFLFGPGQS